MLTATADAVAEAFARHGLREAERRVQRRLGGGRDGAGVIRLAIRVARADAEAVLAELLELAPGGLEEREDGDAIEYVLYGAPGELPALPDVRAAAGGALVDVSTSEIPDDWSERWKAYHRPVDVSWRFRRLRVRPPWEPPLADGLDVEIDPGQAFGTGAHHTTRLCLELLLELEPAGALADWGCGSGRARDRRGAARLGSGAGVRLGGRLGRGDARERAPSTACRGSRSSGSTCAARRARGRRSSSRT